MGSSLQLLALTAIWVTLLIPVKVDASTKLPKKDIIEQKEVTTATPLDVLSKNATDNESYGNGSKDDEGPKALLLSGYYSTCPDGWFKRGNRCYHFSRIAANWIESMMYCMVFDGYLAEINDWSENIYLWNKVRERYWVGGTDVVKENHWIWAHSQTSISTSGYLGWPRGQPDNNKGREHCMEIRPPYRYWNDLPCNYALKFICEKELK